MGLQYPFPTQKKSHSKRAVDSRAKAPLLRAGSRLDPEASKRAQDRVKITSFSELPLVHCHVYGDGIFFIITISTIMFTATIITIAIFGMGIPFLPARV